MTISKSGIKGARTILTVACLGLLAGATGLAAQEPAARVEEEVEVTEVLLDVLVTDSRGNVVLGLDEDDFRVREDGEPVEVESVDFYSNRRFLESSEKARSMGIDPEAVPADRHFVLFFHDARHLLPRIAAQQLDAARRARRWVKTDLLPNDYVAVVGYDFSLEVFQDFTTDREAVAAAIDEAVGAGRREGTRAPPETVRPILAALPEGEALEDATPRIYDGLEVVAKALQPVQGRVNLLLFSIGFGEVDGFGFYTPDVRYYPGTVKTLNDSNVAVYSIDLIPLSADGSLRLAMLGNALSSLSADTGGRYYYNFVSFITPLEQIARDTNGYYLLSYRSRHAGDESGYQRVQVDVTDYDLRVRARKGYLFGDDG